MPELVENSTPPPVPPLPLDAAPPGEDAPPPVAIPPRICPNRWEDFAVFRETFLVYFSELKDNAALRAFGNLILEMTQEYWEHWPDQPEGWLRSNLRAVAADLRHAEGFLVTLSNDPPEEDRFEAYLCRMALRLSQDVAKVAEAIDQELGSWRGEAS